MGGVIQAFTFTTPVDANLVDIRVRLAQVTAGALHFQLYSDAGGQPGSFMSADFTQGAGTFPGIIDFIAPANTVVNAGVNYWFTMSSAGSYFVGAAQPAPNIGSGYVGQVFASSFDGGSSWSLTSNGEDFRAQVNADSLTAVPELDAREGTVPLFFSLLALGLASRSRRRRGESPDGRALF